MNLLLDNFEMLANSAFNAAKLKELILQLAVQGKLVEQDPNDEPASKLLEKIKEEKVKLIKEKKLKKEELLPSNIEDEIPYPLPNGWIWCRLGEITNLITDGTHYTPTYVNQGIPFLSVKDISKGVFDFSDTRFISEKEHKELIKRCNPEYEDILLTKVGTTGIAKVIDVKKDFSIFVSLALIKFSKTNIFPHFLETLINSPLVKKMSAEGTEGIGNKNLVLRKIKKFIIPLPPLPEQHRIVARVESLFAKVDELTKLINASEKNTNELGKSILNELVHANTAEEIKQSWQTTADNFETLFSTQDNVKKLRKTCLQLAVQGKLTHQNRDDEPASRLLEKIKAEKAKLIKEGKLKKEVPVQSIKEDEIPYQLPDEWVWCRLGEICSKIGSGSTPKGGKAVYNETGIPFFRSQNIYNEGLIYNDIARISEKIHFKMKGTWIYPFDLLLNITGGSIGRCALVPEDFKDGNVSQHVTIIRSILNNISVYLHTVAISQGFFNKIMDIQVGISREGLSKKSLEQFVIPLPPIKEQHRIVAKVEKLMSLCDALEEQIIKQKELQQKLMMAVVRDAAGVKDT